MQSVRFFHLIRQVALDSLERLDSPGALADEAVVHELRVATKRLRAVWHLVSKLAGMGVAKRRRRALGKLSARLSGARDLTVLTGLARDLAERQTDERMSLALQRLALALQKKHDDTARSAASEASLTDTLRNAWQVEIEAWDQLCDSDPPRLRHAIRHQLRRSLRRARRDTNEAMKSLDPGWWHDWRKTVKRLRYQREFVALSQERQPGKMDARVHRLGSRLGERNDLANLATFADRVLAEEGLTIGEHGRIRKAIADSEKAIVGNCRRLGRNLFLG